jgi:Flp pilus assembly secretin CpaC
LQFIHHCSLKWRKRSQSDAQALPEDVKSMIRPFAKTLLVVLSLTAGANAIAAEEREIIPIKVDEATLVRLPDRVSTIIIGNPIIADATMQPGGFLVMTGKSYGETNIVALDRKGQILMERTVSVITQPGAVTVFKGINKESYACSPTCEPRLTMGDDTSFFGRVSGQSSSRAARAEGATAVSGSMVSGRTNDMQNMGGGGMNINIQMGGGGFQ